jgi:hypothetical protein
MRANCTRILRITLAEMAKKWARSFHSIPFGAGNVELTLRDAKGAVRTSVH